MKPSETGMQKASKSRKIFQTSQAIVDTIVKELRDWAQDLNQKSRPSILMGIEGVWMAHTCEIQEGGNSWCPCRHGLMAWQDGLHHIGGLETSVRERGLRDKGKQERDGHSFGRRRTTTLWDGFERPKRWGIEEKLSLQERMSLKMCSKRDECYQEADRRTLHLEVVTSTSLVRSPRNWSKGVRIKLIIMITALTCIISLIPKDSRYRVLSTGFLTLGWPMWTRVFNDTVNETSTI